MKPTTQFMSGSQHKKILVNNNVKLLSKNEETLMKNVRLLKENNIFIRGAFCNYQNY